MASSKINPCKVNVANMAIEIKKTQKMGIAGLPKRKNNLICCRTDWLNANKISLNVQKAELVIFEHQRKKIDSEVKIKLSRK